VRVAEDLNREFNDALKGLWPELRKHDLDMGTFLAQAIALHTSEQSLREIIEDLREWAEASRQGKLGE
jgi:hypothetical protein